MTRPPTTTVDEAESAWLAVLREANTEFMRTLLHPQFVAIHSPIGAIQDRDQFLTDVATRPAPEDVRILSATTREFTGMTTVSCLQEVRARFVPDVPAFVLQQAVSRVWWQEEDRWQLAHLVMYRRLLPS